MLTRAVLIAMVSAAPLGACAPRSFPKSFPRTSAASAEAEEAPVARLGGMLEQDPPLPGEPTGSWQGLEEHPPLTEGGAGGKEGAPPARTDDGAQEGREHGN
ncbi:hypothetical protein [Stigmatella aurantiaca]|uniref:Lipoprotein n=1 Tax=Stigmatella aurantiaca (strain DW4/3-1) TaxID=378806 RepID=E3FT02_STIAD|nr:hypothetical protein [Stigmatella aurantiaca]ADO74626.1 uncharacterized protein STAUR_6870 [Stigmatella aurantiaca DW4/3-1]